MEIAGWFGALQQISAPQAAIVLFTILCACLIGACALRTKQTQSIPSVIAGVGRSLFRKYREDAFLIHLQRQGARTQVIDGVTSTCEPSTVRALLMNKEHSIGRSWVYRLIAWIMPMSDGILFSADGEWKKRHSLFTPLFTSAQTRQYELAMAEGAIRTLQVVAGQRSSDTNSKIASTASAMSAVRAHAAHYDSSDSLLSFAVSVSQPPLGSDAGTAGDLLTMVRWSAMRTLLAWGLGVNSDDATCTRSNTVVKSGVSLRDSDVSVHTAAVRRLARCLDAYSRTCFEIMPLAERGAGSAGAPAAAVPGATAADNKQSATVTSSFAFIRGILSWIREYRKLRQIARQLKVLTAPLIAAARASITGTSKESAPLAADARWPWTDQRDSGSSSNAVNATTATPSTNASPASSPDTFLHRMVAAGWSDSEITSEVNHLHGAHKAVAFLVTCALVELSGHRDARERLVQEFERVCGVPPAGMGYQQMLEHVAKLKTTGSTTSATSNSSNDDGGRGVASAAGSSSPSTSSSSSSSSSWRPPTRDDLDSNRLPFLSCVMKETLRRHPVSLGVMRRMGDGTAGFDVRIGYPEGHTAAPGGDRASASASGGSGATTQPTDADSDGSTVHLAPGHEVMIMLHALHHDPASWGDDAHCWEPCRWEKDSGYWRARAEAAASSRAPASSSTTMTSDAASNARLHHQHQHLESLHGHPIPPSTTMSSSTAALSIAPQPPDHCFPAYRPNAFYPFLAGTRQCAGMTLAQLEFAVMLYCFLCCGGVEVVPLVVPVGADAAAAADTAQSSATQPATEQTKHDSSTSEDGRTVYYGGGTGCGSGTLVAAPAAGTAIAVIADSSIVVPHRFEPLVVAQPTAAAAADVGANSQSRTALWTAAPTSAGELARLHLVKRPDMFTTIDGAVPYRIGSGRG